jgi:hypothetical protein
VQDFQELGIKDRGAEIRDIVDEIIRVSQTRLGLPTPQPSNAAKAVLSAVWCMQ